MTTETSNARGDVVAWIEPAAGTIRKYTPEQYESNKDMLHKHGWRPLVYGDTAPQPAAERGDVRGLDRLGWVRRDAIERLRNDLDVTGVMVHDEERTDSVPVYLAAEGVQDEPKAEAQLTYKGVPIGPMQTFADIERQATVPADPRAATEQAIDEAFKRMAPDDYKPMPDRPVPMETPAGLPSPQPAPAGPPQAGNYTNTPGA